MLWKIKGLSDQFIYFNDDVFIVRPTNPSTFFKNNRPVLRESGDYLLMREFYGIKQNIFLKSFL